MCDKPSAWLQRYQKWKQRVGPQLRSGHLADCIFEVGKEPNLFKLCAHKLVLASASPVFESMFYGPIAENNNNIHIPDILPEAFKALLEYIYTDDVVINTCDMACELYYGAKKYMLPQLVKICSEYIVSNVDEQNACKTYEFATIFDDNLLMEECVQIFQNNTAQILKSKNLEDVELNTLIVIFSLDNLNIKSELDLFDAIKRYAISQEERTAGLTVENYKPCIKKCDIPSDIQEKEINADSSIKASPESVCEAEKETTTETVCDVRKKNEDTKELTIRNAIEKIRFLAMAPKEFVDGPAQSSLLTKDEIYAVLMNIISTEAAVPMPSGFSTCREKRLTKQVIEYESDCDLVKILK